MVEIDVNAMMFLKAYRLQLTTQQYKTLRGQVLASDSVGAMNGLKRILERKSKLIYSQASDRQVKKSLRCNSFLDFRTIRASNVQVTCK